MKTTFAALCSWRLLPAHLGVGMGVVDVRGERLQSVEEIAALPQRERRSSGRIGLLSILTVDLRRIRRSRRRLTRLLKSRRDWLARRSRSGVQYAPQRSAEENLLRFQGRASQRRCCMNSACEDGRITSDI